jgi:hypothetical protein
MKRLPTGLLSRLLLAFVILCVGGLSLALSRSHGAPPPPHKTLAALRAAATSVSVDAAAYYSQNQSRLTNVADVFDGDASATWNFERGIPAGWRHSSAVRIQRTSPRGTLIETTPTNFEQQLLSPPVLLQPGQYQIVLEGGVVRGGLALGGEHGTTCLGNSFFSATQWHTLTQGFMVHALSIRNPQSVRIVLSNWARPNASSRWKLNDVSIRPLSLDQKIAAEYSARTSPLVRLNQFPVMNDRFTWHIGRTLNDWVPRGARMIRTTAGRVIRTHPSTYGYVLTTQVELQPGPYLLLMNGGIVSGGVSLGAIDVATHRWLEQSFYWYGQSGSPGAIATKFSVRHSGGVELVLANWSVVVPRSSTWRVRGIELIQLF